MSKRWLVKEFHIASKVMPKTKFIARADITRRPSLAEGHEGTPPGAVRSGQAKARGRENGGTQHQIRSIIDEQNEASILLYESTNEVLGALTEGAETSAKGPYTNGHQE
jgi:hypothetical protein